ncbi:hypothetical protein [Streptomyces sp. NPDC059224]|uniref:hypothetical protein n=1 Tax=Streptomyces sp. NPDC059224 TaxID=3346775 RepID=UPI0036BF5288
MPRRILMRLLRRTPRPAPVLPGRTHNYDNDHRRWGHDYTLSPYSATPDQVTATGWGYDIEEGDYLLVGRPEAPWKLKVIDIVYDRDPRDFWSATLSVVVQPPVRVLEWKGSAGEFLQSALGRAGVQSHATGDSAGEYIKVPAGTQGLITITGVSGRARENELCYRPNDHQGWGAVIEQEGADFTEFYQSTSSDLAEDTARVVRAVQEIIAKCSAS